MLENDAKFYEATYSGEGIEKREKYKFVVIKKVSHLLRSETIETESMHQAQYNKSDKTNHLITFAVDVACKDKLKKCIDSQLKDNSFDKENPQAFLDLIKEEFELEQKDDFSYILAQRFNTSATLESEDDDNRLIKLVEGWEVWLSRQKEEGSEFDKDNKFSGQLGELKNKLMDNQGEESKEKRGLINKFNEIKYQIKLQYILPTGLGFLKQLQDRFAGAEPEYLSIQSLINKFSSELKGFGKKNSVKNIKKLKELSDSIEEQSELYEDKLYQSISGLRERINAVQNQLSALESLPLFLQSKELLKKEFLDGKIGEFHEALKIKSLVELEKHAVFIETTFNIQLDLVKKDFVEVSKQRLETASKHVYSYYKAESATPILKEIASLQSMLADISPNDVAQFGSAIESVNKCVKSAEAFYDEASKDETYKKEEAPKIAFRKGSSNVAQFFAEKMDVLNDLKKHGEKIRNVSKLAHTKADILGEIFAKAEEIKNQHQSLIETPVLDKSKAQKMNADISYIVKFIDDNKDTLSRYRGISALKPLAKLWGGGKVTSEEYVNKIKDQLIKSENSASAWSLAN